MKVQPDPRIAEYIKEISQPGIPYVSRSQVILYRLGLEHGHILVQKLLDDYWKAVNAT